MAILKKTAIASVLAVSLTTTSVWAEGRGVEMSENQIKQAMVSTQGNLTGDAAASSAGIMWVLVLLTIAVIAGAAASGDPLAVVYD